MRIAEFLQTPFISHDNKNMIRLRVDGWDFCNPYKVEFLVDGKTVFCNRFFASKISVLIPVYDDVITCTVRITPLEELPYEKDFTLVPQKNWEIALIYSSHEDLGYCGYIDKLHYNFYVTLKKAMSLCVENPDFKYMIEHYWWLDAFDSYATDEEKNQLKTLFKSRKIELNAIHSGVHTHWADSEQLVREMYFSCIDALRKYEVKPECAIYSDISGFSMSCVNAHAKMGIKYMGVLANSFRCGKSNEDFPPIFRLCDKSGEESVLLWYQRNYRAEGLNKIWCDTKRQYEEGEFVFDNTKILKTEEWFADKLSKLANYDYELLPVSFYDDREEPTTMLLNVCEEMNKKWKYPRFSMDIPSAVFERIAKSGLYSIPVFCGEITDQWADYATISPSLTAKKRSLSRLFYDAELLSSLDSIKNKTPYRKDAFDFAIHSMCEFDEHCWATASKHPQDMHKSNIDKVKREPVSKAFSELSEILYGLNGKPEGKRISVTNTVPQKRSCRLRISSDTTIPKNLAHQILPDSTVITDNLDFNGIETKYYDSVIPSSKSIETDITVFETEFYKVDINPSTQTIKSIFDKSTQKQLIDSDAKFELGQFIYLYSEHRIKPESYYEVAKKTETKIFEGELAFVILQKSREEQSGAEITAQFIFYKNEKNIDIDLSYKNATANIGDYYDRYKKNLFFAFPLRLDSPEFYTESQVGEKNENTDTLPLNANDFTVTQNWVAAENSQGGIALYTEQMPVFHLGKLKYNNFEQSFSENKAHFYLYAASNRCNNLIYSTTEECCAEFHLSILPYSGKHNAVVPEWSNSKCRKLLLGSKDKGVAGKITVDKKNLRLICFKKAEKEDNSIIMRFVETEGKETDCCVELFFSPTKANYATNDENDLNSVEIKDNRVRFKSRPYSYTTIKIYGDF